jgi:transposase
MKRVELYAQVRRAVYVEGLSRREAARRFGIDPRTVAKMLAFSVPLGYWRSRPPARPKLDPFIGIIDRILEDDKLQPPKQQHTAKRIFERLRDEHGYEGGVSIVRATCTSTASGSARCSCHCATILDTRKLTLVKRSR